ncbi:hypothetical protein BDB01DRAFT_896390 [Pilobolus umbonatus]|nr:hypothetical protein BDB01DRAFT_896390 [Pilobolus umbonatus]
MEGSCSKPVILNCTVFNTSTSMINIEVLKHRAVHLYFENMSEGLNQGILIFLYNISKTVYAKLLDKNAIVIEELNKFNDICCKQYEKVLAMLADGSLPRSKIKECTSQSLKYTIQQKRNFDKITSEDYLSEDQDLDKRIDRGWRIYEFCRNFQKRKE